jgi:hypothetical protein
MEQIPVTTSFQRVERELVIRVMFGHAYRYMGNELKELIFDGSVCARYGFLGG